MNGWLSRYRRTLARPVDGASLAVFRIVFGGCVAVEVVRYFHRSWIHRYFIEPVMTFTLPGFEFLLLLPPAAMYVHFTVMGVAAVCVTLGLWYRAAIPVDPSALGFAGGPRRELREHRRG